MIEHVVQMGPMLVLAGLMVAWTAEAVSRAGGYGFTPDMVLALTGSVIVGGLVWIVVSSGPGMLGMLMVGVAGAGLGLAAQRGLWRSTRRGT
jgi:hypothetical protein